jgi:lipopolysaccharide transport system ATP-binding protein
VTASSDTAIQVRNIGKKYRLGREIPPAGSIGSRLAQSVGAPFRWLTSQFRAPTEEETLWALRDVSFDVRSGEVVGIIGHNGAGKSTLLKILSRITEPTTGHAEIHGRIAALLEVGTGMHPELTGRENIFMNGTVLGMKKREIQGKFDEIVEFSGVGRFLDTPVKRYSSGMRVRLGFAIAAHLEPEILIIDEVLAVGDAAFQQKCLGKMQDVSSHGRTVLFVSHRMEAVRSLCSRAILLQHGHLYKDGPCAEIIAEYYRLLREAEVDEASAADNPSFRRGSGKVRISSVHAINPAGHVSYVVSQGDDVRFAIEYTVTEDVPNLYAMVGLKSARTGELITTTRRHPVSASPLHKGQKGTFVVHLPGPPLRSGEFPLYFGLTDKDRTPFDVVDDMTSPLVITTDKTIEQLGYDPTKAVGYFNVESMIERGQTSPAAP